jgi:hypothetical protein
MPTGRKDGEGVRRQHVAAAAAMTAGAVAMLAGCSSGSSGGTTLTGNPVKTHHHHKTAAPSATPTDTPTPVTTVTVTSSPTSSAPAEPENLSVTPAVRHQLVRAGAATHQLPAKDFTGLVPGSTYYGYDPATATYWAGAGLVPSSSSQDAQISVQDDGSYLIFKRGSSGGWTGYNVGLAGIAGATCPVQPPKKITALWHWDKGDCRPPS